MRSMRLLITALSLSWVWEGASASPRDLTFPPVLDTFSSGSLVAANGIVNAHCGGALEKKIWRLWDEQGRSILQQQLIKGRLFTDGDTYALYDIQIYFHNLESMAERCQRTDRLIELADDLMPVFRALEILPDGNGKDVGWICRGGLVCNANNGLIDKEVLLVSVQGLGLVSAVANALAQSADLRAREHPFVDSVVEVSVSHLLRWANGRTRHEWERLTAASPDEIKNDSSALLFTDKALWQLAIYANLAGIVAPRIALPRRAARVNLALDDLARNAQLLLRFFRARTTLTGRENYPSKEIIAAEIDRGFWSFYPEYRFAGYTDSHEPVTCLGEDIKINDISITKTDVPVVRTLGWDFSHARRLVQVMRALNANNDALRALYKMPLSVFLEKDLTKFFAAQLVTVIWNGNADRPLFSNYWQGANGWYRVTYDKRSGGCSAGIPPFGLSESFITGGYIEWSYYYPKLGELGIRIMNLSESHRIDDQDFINVYYKGLSRSASADKRMLTQIMFWPTLIK